MALLKISSTRLLQNQKIAATQSIIALALNTEATDLKAILQQKIPQEQEKIKALRKEHGSTKMGEITLDMMYDGMSGMNGMIWETSVLDPDEGIRFRGYSISECRRLLPKVKDGCEALPEGLFWLLVTGDVPTEAQAKSLSNEWAQRAQLPSHVVSLLINLPENVHPMSQLAAAVTILNSESKFVKAYTEGVHKSKYWEYTYEDCMNLIANLPAIAAIIYRNIYRSGSNIGCIDTSKDWSANFAHMLGYDNPEFTELLRLYLTILSDHEGGNVTAHSTHSVGSALGDPYLSFAAGINGLAGPLHGLANQEVLIWLKNIIKQIGEDPTEEQLKEFIWESLKSGQVVPGFGHAVLRIIDPRHLCLREFAEKYLPDDKMFKTMSSVCQVVPPILLELGQVKNPWPNVNALTGVLLQHYGMTEMNYYTVLFGVSRGLGVLAQLIWSRALGLPIETPKSFSTDYIIKMLKK